MLASTANIDQRYNDTPALLMLSSPPLLLSFSPLHCHVCVLLSPLSSVRQSCSFSTATVRASSRRRPFRLRSAGAVGRAWRCGRPCRTGWPGSRRSGRRGCRCRGQGRHAR